MITFTIEAESVEELRAKAILALDLRIATPAQAEAKVGALTQPEAKRPVGRPRKVQPEPLPEIDPVDEALEEGFLSNEDGVVVSVPGLDPEPNGVDRDPVSLEKLKQEVIAKLPDMFVAGKVILMRAVLTKYGKGAKSFPEIEASEFPLIAAAFERGDGS